MIRNTNVKAVRGFDAISDMNKVNKAVKIRKKPEGIKLAYATLWFNKCSRADPLLVVWLQCSSIVFFVQISSKRQGKVWSAGSDGHFLKRKYVTRVLEIKLFPHDQWLGSVVCCHIMKRRWWIEAKKIIHEILIEAYEYIYSQRKDPYLSMQII